MERVTPCCSPVSWLTTGWATGGSIYYTICWELTQGFWQEREWWGPSRIHTIHTLRMPCSGQFPTNRTERHVSNSRVGGVLPNGIGSVLGWTMIRHWPVPVISCPVSADNLLSQRYCPCKEHESNGLNRSIPYPVFLSITFKSHYIFKHHSV